MWLIVISLLSIFFQFFILFQFIWHILITWSHKKKKKKLHTSAYDKVMTRTRILKLIKYRNYIYIFFLVEDIVINPLIKYKVKQHITTNLIG